LIISKEASMPQKPSEKTGRGKQSAARGQHLAESAKSSGSSTTPPKSKASREQASKAADAGAAPEQLDSEVE
jgi:hypothetical protein